MNYEHVALITVTVTVAVMALVAHAMFGVGNMP
jgi:hypothetical protein